MQGIEEITGSFSKERKYSSEEFIEICQYVNSALGVSALEGMFNIVSKDSEICLDKIVSLLMTVQQEEEKQG